VFGGWNWCVGCGVGENRFDAIDPSCICESSSASMISPSCVSGSSLEGFMWCRWMFLIWFKAWGLGFGVWGLEFQVWGLGLVVLGFGFGGGGEGGVQFYRPAFPRG